MTREIPRSYLPTDPLTHGARRQSHFVVPMPRLLTGSAGKDPAVRRRANHGVLIQGTADQPRRNTSVGTQAREHMRPEHKRPEHESPARGPAAARAPGPWRANHRYPQVMGAEAQVSRIASGLAFCFRLA